MIAFFFDLDNTLFNYEASFEQASLFAFESLFKNKLEGIDSTEWFKVYKYYCDLYWPTYETKRMTREQYQRSRLSSSLEAFHVKINNEDHFTQYQYLVEEILPNFVEPYPWISTILKMLHREGKVYGVITNGFSNLQRKKLLKFDIPSKHIYISSEIKLEKPEPAVFHFVSDQYKDKQCVYIGDSYLFDIVPAVQANWETIWWNPDSLPVPKRVDGRIITCHTSDELIKTIKRYIG